ncbi:hypothetical protein [Sphingomonas sp. UYAg733]
MGHHARDPGDPQELGGAGDRPRSARAVRRTGDAEIWSKPLADGSVALALFNRGTRPIDIA